MNLLSVDLGTLIDRTLLELRSPTEVGKQVRVYADIADTDVTFQLAAIDGELDSDSLGVNVSDLIEVDAEVMQVSAKTDAAQPVYTVNRGYLGTIAADHESTTIAVVNPPFLRVRVAEALRRSFARLEALGLPLYSTDTYNVETDKAYALMPAETRDIIAVRYVVDTYGGRVVDVPAWTFQDDLPTSKFSTGKALMLPATAFSSVLNDVDLEVTIQTPYRWSTHPDPPDESATISVIEGTEDLPAAYAAAWLVGAREISRSQLERSEEWNQGEPVRNGVSLSLLKSKWQDFYRALDEGRHLIPTRPIHRPFRPMAKLMRTT